MKRKITGYIIFTLCCMGYAIYTQFPGNSVADYLQNRAREIHPELRLFVEGVRLKWPLGLSVSRVSPELEDLDWLWMDNLSADLMLLPLVSGDVAVAFNAGLLKGKVAGEWRTPMGLNLIAGTGAVPQGQIRMEWNNLIVDDRPLPQSFGGGRISCKVDGRVRNRLDDPSDIQVLGDIEMSELKVVFPEGLFFIDRCEFNQGKITFRMDRQGRFVLETGRLTGRYMDVAVKGTIQLGNPVIDSRLDLDLSATLFPMFFMNAGKELPVKPPKQGEEKTSVEFSVKGSFKSPTVTMRKAG